MPAFYAHLRFGEETAKLLPQSFQDLISAYPEAFRLGTQGPDVLFYHHPLKKNEIRAHGYALHGQSGETFFTEQAKKLQANQENDALKAYTCGFLCHYTLDTLCHPFINEHSGDAVSHGRIESEFDKHVLRKDGKPIRGHKTAKRIVNENGVQEACSITVDVPQSNIALSIKTMRKFNSWFSKKSKLFNFSIHCLLKMLGIDRKFGDMFTHKKDAPLCVAFNETLYEKFSNGQALAAEFIQDYFDNLEQIADTGIIEKDFFRYNFGGIKNKGEDTNAKL